VEPTTQYPPQQYNYEPVPTGRPKGPRTLGVVGLVLALLALVGGGIASGSLGAVMSRLINYLAVEDGPGPTPGPGPDLGVYLISALLLGLAALVGVAALIISIVATALNRGRGQGVAGIVFACLAPIVCLAVLVTTLTAGLDGNLDDLQRRMDELNSQDYAWVLPSLTARLGL